MPTPKQLVDAARRAEAAGDAAAAERLKAAARAAVAPNASAGPSAPQHEPTWGSNIADLGRGAAFGVRETARDAQGLFAWGAGKLGADDYSQDLLSRVNARREQDEARTAEYRERSPMLFGAGEFLGGTAALLPVGGVGGMGAKGLVRGGASLLGRTAGRFTVGAAGLAGEGATVGAVMSGGENVGSEAAAGAATDLAIGGAINAVTRGGGTAFRRFWNRSDAQRRLSDNLGPASERVIKAQDAGGYNLPAPMAVGTREALDDYNALRRAPDSGRIINEAEGRMESDIADRARQLAGQQGSNTSLSLEETATRLQRALATARRIDEREYRNLYRQFDRMAAENGTYLNPNRLAQDLGLIRNDPRMVDSSVIRLAKGLDDDFAKRGVYLTEEARNKALKGVNNVPSSMRRDAVLLSENSLTIEKAEDLIQTINNHWKDTGMTQGQKRYLTQLKKALDTHIDNFLEEAGATSETVELARGARRARAAFAENWNSNDIVDKISQRTTNREFAVDYSRGLPKLSRNDIANIQARLLTTENGQRAWESLKQAPLLEAIDAATTGYKTTANGVQVFDNKAFRRTIEKFPRGVREKLWGKDFTDQLDEAMDAWDLRTKSPRSGPVGRRDDFAFDIARQARFLQSGPARNYGMALNGLFPDIRNWMTRGARMRGAEAAANGNMLPQKTHNDMIDGILQEFEQNFTGANGQRYGNALRLFLRVGAVEGVMDDE